MEPLVLIAEAAILVARLATETIRLATSIVEAHVQSEGKNRPENNGDRR